MIIEKKIHGQRLTRVLICPLCAHFVVATIPQSYAEEARDYINEAVETGNLSSIFDYFLGGISYRAANFILQIAKIFRPDSSRCLYDQKE